MTTDALILDTCAVIWLSQQVPIAKEAVERITATNGRRDLLKVSAMSAWEIGMLVSKGRLPYIKSPLAWFEQFVEAGAVSVEEVDREVLVESSFLPGVIHNDPTDRIIIATARSKNLAIVTRDRAILAYGSSGFVKTVPC
jgi:PIN domain nuclease of toxin-antitoxin system